ncbi:MAG: nuclease-related domain-containing protein [Alkalibacterium gilvum]|uniref:Nuclease-related domain-containing protein n=1 Tax=Alkalibacterium gilvum TaxID=1130080 RepID=A0A1H6UVA6_9LACT|nr:nuclease-related domain-containing protein [Alkalibacterium gilvum]SEI92270.1 Nuclease-related domain-containing protein [Alkalibacterium gilvum]
MELLKARAKAEILIVLELLDKRMTLSSSEKQYMSTLSKGFNGEVLFDSYMEKYFPTNAIVINDVSLMLSSTSFQIDSIMLTSDTLYLYEVKNYKGDFTNRITHFLTAAGQEIENPVNQLSRTAMLLSKLLRKWNLTLPIKSFIVFIHPTFILYEAKNTDPFIFPSQLKYHFNTVSHQSGTITNKVYNVAEKLIKETQKELPYQRQLPCYSFELLKKGLLCSQCGSLDLTITTKKGECRTCGKSTSISVLFLSQVEAFKTLFPESLITSNLMYEWCGKMLTKRRIATLLNATFEKTSYGKSTHYL